MFCVNCGKQVTNPNATFCSGCGNAVRESEVNMPNVNADISQYVPAHNYEYSTTNSVSPAKTLWRYPLDSKMPYFAGGLFIAAAIIPGVAQLITGGFFGRILNVVLFSLLALLPLILFSFIWAKRNPKLILLFIGLFIVLTFLFF